MGTYGFYLMQDGYPCAGKKGKGKVGGQLQRNVLKYNWANENVLCALIDFISYRMGTYGFCLMQDGYTCAGKKGKGKAGGQLQTNVLNYKWANENALGSYMCFVL